MVLTHILFITFLPRDAMHKRGIWRHAVSVGHIRELRQNISLKFFHRRVATPFYFFRSKRGGSGTIPTGTPLTGGQMQGDMKKWRFSTDISLCLRNGYS